MEDKKKIKTFKRVYPQIYSYVLPNRQENKGWQKIGYTERKNVDDRIREQTHTAAFSEEYKKLWSASAVYHSVKGNKFFKDGDLHKFLVKNGIKKDGGLGKEWFFFNGTPEKSRQLFEDFRKQNFESFKNSSNKKEYTLRKEQAEAVEMTLKYASENQTTDFENPNEDAEFLWNAKPRFGKTLTTYDFMKKFGARSVLIVTNRPSIVNSWFDDYEEFIDGYYFISTTGSLKERKTLSREDFNKIPGLDKKQITFLSLQDLKGAKIFGGNFDKLEYVAGLNWDLLVIDEAHEGTDTKKAGFVFDKIKRKFTLHLSGTPFRALANGDFREEQIFNWTYIDEQRAKKAEIESGNETGDHFDIPDMRLFAYKMSDVILEKVEEGVEIQGRNVDHTFNLNEFFSTNEKGDFVYENDVRRFLDRLTTNKKYPFSTPELREKLRHTFWWVGRKVASAKAMEKMLRKHPVFGEYEIILAAGDGRKLTDEDDFEKEANDSKRNEKSLERVRNAIRENDKTITLSVGQLTTGVTVEAWSAVLMLTEIKSETLYTQAIFRAQNPYKFFENGQWYRKKSAYVFDFSPARVLEVYDKFANSLIAQTAQGRTTEEVRSANVAELLNFFPVIAEDKLGEMIELNAEQVLTFPKAIIAKQIVDARFMTSLLFKNIRIVYNLPREVRDSVDKLANTKQDGKPSKNKTDLKPDPERRERTQRRISANRQHINFGQKIYGNKIFDMIESSLDSGVENFGNNFAKDIQEEVLAEPIAVWVETYSPSKKEAQETEKNIEEKIKELSKDFISTEMQEADKKALAREVSEFIENELPRDMIDEREEKEFKKQEKTDLDIIREKLKTFSRAIPSMVMASHNTEKLTIDNIENILSDEDFEALFTKKDSKEPFTKDDFRRLRDGMEYIDEKTGEKQFFDGFFNKYEFNAAIQEFEAKRRELADYLTTTTKEDIFTYIPSQKSNQIFTPRRAVNQMLNILEKENPGIFENPNLTFADLYVKSGLYLTEIAKRLYRGLESKIPDSQARIKHIFEHQLYGFAPTQIIYDIATNYIYNGLDGVSRQNFKLKDLTPDFKEGRTLNMKFDVVIGNPPYQEGNYQIYADFYVNAIKQADNVCMIFPTGWQKFKTTNGLKKMNTPEIKYDCQIVQIDNRQNVFPGVSGAEWTNIILWKRFYDNGLNGKQKILTEGSDPIMIKLPTSKEDVEKPAEILSIFDKVNSFDSQKISSIGSASKPYGFRADPIDNPEKYNLILSDKRTEIYDIRLLANRNRKRTHMFIERSKLVRESEMLEKFKIFVPKAWGNMDEKKGFLGGSYSKIEIAEPFDACSELFIEFGPFNKREEAENARKYFYTKFFRAVFYRDKITHNTAKETYRNVPLQNFTPDSDIDWSKSIAEIDQQLYKKYGLSEQEIAFIEEKVRAME